MYADEEDACVRFMEYAPVPAGQVFTSDWAVCLEDDDPYTWTCPRAFADTGHSQPIPEKNVPSDSCSSNKGAAEDGQQHWAWLEMMPVPIVLWESLSSLIRSRSSLRKGKAVGNLTLRHNKRTIRVEVVFHNTGDLRLYWGSERPAIRPKTAQQRMEASEACRPGSSDSED